MSNRIECTKCGCLFVISPTNLRRSDYSCRPCTRERDQVYYAKPEIKKHRAEKARERYQNPEERRRAICRGKTRSAVKYGTLEKGPCEVCGLKKSEAHHDDYDNHLMVRWLCREHHRDHHDRMEGHR